MREMKESGVEWLGDIPETWKLVQLGSLFSEHKQKNIGMQFNNLLSLSYGNIIRKDINTSDGLLPESFESYNVIDVGDIVLRLTDLQNDQRSLRVGLSHENGIVTSAYVTLRRRNPELNSQFFYYLLHSYDVRKGFYGMGGGVRQGLNYAGVKKIMLVFPPVDEQTVISSFLEGKLAKVDALITNVQAQIEKLKQYKQSLITEVVTRGLDPTVPMKDSGIQWLPTMPIGWKLSRIKNEIIPLERPVLADDEVITCFRDGVVTLRRRRREDGFTVSFTEHGYQGVEIGDLVIHGMDTFAGAIGCSDSRGKTTPVVHVCRTTGNNRYFMYFLRSMAYNHVYMDFSNGVRIRSSDFRNFAKLAIFDIIVPPLDEQDAIVEYLDSKSAQIDRLLALKQAKIDKLNEYKKSFIYEYVTGKREA